MTTYQSTVILKEVNNLITHSCRGEMARTGRFNTMHRAIIKKHFNAREVFIHDDLREIGLKIEAKENEFVNVNFKCPNLESFLKSCIENDRNSLAFYQHLLTYYNVVALPN
ncbi:MAG TPA: hypothetical protein VFM65_02410 [Flavobacteriaceae bacterium]|nr:hypothetical protein [Flavobacteriaceae bacterium]